jgi:hypothetical protein
MGILGEEADREDAADRKPLDQPIFIVGPSRSGTSLLRVVLSQHDRVWITRETHYFDDLRTRLAPHARTGLTPAERELCETYFLRLGHRPYGAEADPESSALERDDLRHQADRFGDGADAYFEAFCSIVAEIRGKPIWGEKTPRHVFQIDELFAFAPGAKLICLVRDPRAVVASYRDWHATRPTDESNPDDVAFVRDRRRAIRSFHVGLITILWRGAMRASQAALARYGPERVYLLRFEDLATDPRRTVTELCQWLGLDFQEAMLDVPLVQSSYSSDEKGISKEPLERWRRKLSRGEIAAIQTFAGGTADELGYSREPVRGSLPAVAWAGATLPFAVVRAGFVNRARLGKATKYVQRRLRFAFL